MKIVDENGARTIDEFAVRLMKRLAGRAEMNERTALTHPDPTCRALTAGRAEGYRIAVDEVDSIARATREAVVAQEGPTGASPAPGRPDAPPRAPDAPTGLRGAPVRVSAWVNEVVRKALFERPRFGCLNCGVRVLHLGQMCGSCRPPPRDG